MKKCLMRCLMLSALMVMMTGSAFQPFCVDSARAMGWIGDHEPGGGGQEGGTGNTYETPEPGTLSMLLTSLAGVGTYLAVRRGRKDRHK